MFKVGSIVVSSSDIKYNESCKIDRYDNPAIIKEITSCSIMGTRGLLARVDTKTWGGKTFGWYDINELELVPEKGVDNEMSA